MIPCLFIIDLYQSSIEPDKNFMNSDLNGTVFWPPIDSMIQEARSLIVQTMRVALDDVSIRLGEGKYNLDRWR